MPQHLDEALHDVSATSAGGAPFLICFGATLLSAAVLSLFLTRSQAALVVMFQGGFALPAAFWLERRMTGRAMAPENPLRPLSIQLAMSQTLALPIVIVVFTMNPGAVPIAMASIAGGHFLPYAWLQRTHAYTALAIVVSIGAFALQVLLGHRAFPWILAWMAASYWVAASVVYRRAARLVERGRGEVKRR